jgi:hypothetical protein
MGGPFHAAPLSTAGRLLARMPATADDHPLENRRNRFRVCRRTATTRTMPILRVLAFRANRRFRIVGHVNSTVITRFASRAQYPPKEGDEKANFVRFARETMTPMSGKKTPMSGNGAAILICLKLSKKKRQGGRYEY